MIRTIIRYTDNKLFLNDAEVFETSKTLHSGMYDMEFDEHGKFKNFVLLKLPRVYPLFPSTELENIASYMEIFLSEEYRSFCKDTNILCKTGVMLYGEAGIGKSNYINNIINSVIKDSQACIFNINTSQKLFGIIPKLRELRAIQDNLFVIVLEEIDEILRDGIESVLKNFMDGIDSVDNLLFLASTNYIERVPITLIERPSRFKKTIKIEQTSDIEALKSWLSETYKIFLPNLTKEECEELHEKCINRTIDEIKHILIDYKMGIESLTQKKQRLGFKKV